MDQQAKLSNALLINDTSNLFDEFNVYTDAATWTKTGTGSHAGTVALSSTTDQVVLTTASGGVYYTAFFTTTPLWLFANNQNMYAECYFNTPNLTDSGVWFGWSSSTALFASSTADPSVSYSGAGIYYESGATYASCQSSNGSTKTTHSPCKNGLFANGTTNPAVNHVFRIDASNFDASNALITYRVDGEYLKDNTTGLQIADKLAYASLAQMYIGFAICAVSTADVANVDYIGVGKNRLLLQ